jgi:hypothetical protein
VPEYSIAVMNGFFKIISGYVMPVDIVSKFTIAFEIHA